MSMTPFPASRPPTAALDKLPCTVGVLIKESSARENVAGKRFRTIGCWKKERRRCSTKKRSYG